MLGKRVYYHYIRDNPDHGRIVKWKVKKITHHASHSTCNHVTLMAPSIYRNVSYPPLASAYAWLARKKSPVTFRVCGDVTQACMLIRTATVAHRLPSADISLKKIRSSWKSLSLIEGSPFLTLRISLAWLLPFLPSHFSFSQTPQIKSP